MPPILSYGSNLNRLDLRGFAERNGLPAPRLHALGRVWLTDHRLSFGYHSRSRGGGALDVVPATGFVVPGVLFDVDAPTLALLDRKEGHPTYYQRHEVLVHRDGHVIPALTWTVVPERRVAHVEPTIRYVELVEEAWTHWGLPLHALQQAVTDDVPPVDKAFVYGTLCSGHEHAACLPGHRERWAVDGATCFDMGRHAAMRLGPGGHVSGELVHDIPELDEVLPDLDARMAEFGLHRTLVDLGVTWAWSWVGDPWASDDRVVDCWPSLRPPSRVAHFHWRSEW